MVEDGQKFGRVTVAEVEVLLKSGIVEVDSGLDVTDTEVKDDEGAVVALEGMTGVGVGGFEPTVPGCDTAALDAPAATLVKGL